HPNAPLGIGPELLELALAAAASVDLRLHHPQRPGQLPGGCDGLLNAHCGVARGHRNAELGGKFLGLVFVNVHDAAALARLNRRCKVAAKFTKFTLQRAPTWARACPVRTRGEQNRRRSFASARMTPPRLERML